MLVDHVTINKPNYRNRVGISLRPEFLANTNLEIFDKAYIIYDKDKVIITKSLDFIKKIEEREKELQEML